MPRPRHQDRRDSGPHRSKPKFRRGDTPREWRGGEGRDQAPGAEERLQKVLAAMGVGSRRDCEELIREGRVEVDKQVVTVLGTKVDPLKHEIRVDGEALKRPERMYFAVNKPEGVVTTNFDPSGRERVIDLVPTDARLFAVGRLDRSSEGLILLTNDGEFANRLTHPRYGVEKTYLVRVAGEPGESELNKLRRGVYLSDGVCRVQRIVVKGKHKQSTDMIIVLNEGRNREIRRILARVGHKVLKLRRVGIGRLKLGDLPLGAWRKLAPPEVEGLMREAKPQRRDRGQETGNRRRETTRSASEGPETLARHASEGMGRGVPDEVLDDQKSKRELMPELAGDEDDGDIEMGDFAASADEMVEISGFSDDDTGATPPPGEVLDYEEDEELEAEDFGDAEEALPTPLQGKPPRRQERERPPGRPEQKFGKPSAPNRAGGGRPFKKKQYERGGARHAGAGEGSSEATSEKPARKFGRRGGRVKFAPKAGAKTGARPTGKPGRKFAPRTEGQSAGGGGYGAKFGGGPGKKFRGKPGGKPFGKPGGKFGGGKKRFKPKEKGRP